MTTASEGCGAHAGVGEELRALALAALDRIDPVIDRLRDEPAGDAAGTDGTVCTACPVCAVLGALRGERPELAASLAEHAAGLVTVLRAALEEGAPAPPQAAAPAPPPPARRVQHIRIERQAR